MVEVGVGGACAKQNEAERAREACEQEAKRGAGAKWSEHRTGVSKGGDGEHVRSRTSEGRVASKETNQLTMLRGNARHCQQ